MQLEVGKSYIRRDGKKAKCVYQCLFKPDKFIVEHGDIKSTVLHRADGRVVDSDNDSPDLDLVRLADEPPAPSNRCPRCGRSHDDSVFSPICDRCSEKEATAPVVVRVERVYEDGVGDKWKINQTIDDVFWGTDTKDGHRHRIFCSDGKAYGIESLSSLNLVRDVTPAPSEPAPVIDGVGDWMAGNGCKVTLETKSAGMEPTWDDKGVRLYLGDYFSGYIWHSEYSKGVGRWNAITGDRVGKFPDRFRKEFRIVGRWKEPEPCPAVPWDSPADVPMPVCWVRWKDGKYEGRDDDKEVGEWLVTGKTPAHIAFCGNSHAWRMCQHLEYSTDGREWKPCVKGGG